MHRLARYGLAAAVLGITVFAITAILGVAQAVTPTLQRTEVVVKKQVPNGQIIDIVATCPRGYVVTGGGVGIGANDLIFADTNNARTWDLAVGNFSTLSTASAHATAFCFRGAKNLAIRASVTKTERSELIRQVLQAHR